MAEYTARKSFLNLHPDDVLNLVEKTLQTELNNLFRPLNSYINRVFELESRNGQGIIVKFYRPGRWTQSALLEEHQFLQDLLEYEIPVICPLKLKNGETLGSWRDVHFAVFPKCGGRSLDEFNDEQWQELGRLIGRIHAVGATRESPQRLRMHPTQSTVEQIEYILENDLVINELKGRFTEITDQLIGELEPYFEGVKMQRIHGDLHFSNIIYRPGESFYIIDFDDMVMGPQVQDIWMLLQKYSDESFVELDMFLEGYEMFHRFDKRTCRLIEPLRAMRYIHYLAWCGYQVVEDGRTMIISDFGSQPFWQREIAELEDQIERIRDTRNPFDVC